MPNLSGPTLIVILFIILLLFGAPKLPALARSLGQSMKILKKEVSSSDEEKAAAEADAPASSTVSPAAPVNPAATVAPSVTPNASPSEDELAKAKAEAEAAKAEAEALRVASENRTPEK